MLDLKGIDESACRYVSRHAPPMERRSVNMVLYFGMVRSRRLSWLWRRFNDRHGDFYGCHDPTETFMAVTETCWRRGLLQEHEDCLVEQQLFISRYLKP